MQPPHALHEFERFLAGRKQTLASLTVSVGTDAMLDFYRDVRADGCDLSRDHDMLLYQWGVDDQGHGKVFELDITRQLMFGAIEDEDTWQLSLTFLFTPSPVFIAVPAGNRWCHSLDEYAEFQAFIRSSAAYAIASVMLPLRIDLSYDCAG